MDGLPETASQTGGWDAGPLNCLNEDGAVTSSCLSVLCDLVKPW